MGKMARKQRDKSRNGDARAAQAMATLRKESAHFSPKEQAARKSRFREGLKLHEIENNPLGDESLAMFAMFDQEDWPDRQRRASILDKARSRAILP